MLDVQGLRHPDRTQRHVAPRVNQLPQGKVRHRAKENGSGCPLPLSPVHFRLRLQGETDARADRDASVRTSPIGRIDCHLGHRGARRTDLAGALVALGETRGDLLLVLGEAFVTGRELAVGIRPREDDFRKKLPNTVTPE